MQKSTGYTVTTSNDYARNYIPLASRIITDHTSIFVRTDAAACKKAKKNGVKLIYGMGNVPDGIYIDSLENRKTIEEQLKKNPQYKHCHSFLIQEGYFKNISAQNVTGIDSIIEWRYMGSSEFEWGALPESLHRIVNDIANYSFYNVESVKDISGNCMKIFSKKQNQQDYVAEAISVSKEPYGYQEYCHLKDYVTNATYPNGTTYCADICNPNFWWDIRNDYFIFFGDDHQEALQTALHNLTVKFAKWGQVNEKNH